MALRTAHGNAAKLGRLTASELTPADELRPATPALAVRPQRDTGGRFLPGNKAGAAKRVKAGSRGALVALERKGDPAARAALAFGRRYASHRRSELASCHGGTLSAGVGAMVESAGELLSASRYWSARSIAEANPDYARLAAQLVAGARQAERDAWELASREAPLRPKSKQEAAAAYPWLAPAAPPRATENAFQASDGAEGGSPDSQNDADASRSEAGE
jgi:hypothetical protein